MCSMTEICGQGAARLHKGRINGAPGNAGGAVYFEGFCSGFLQCAGQGASFRLLYRRLPQAGCQTVNPRPVSPVLCAIPAFVLVPVRRVRCRQDETLKCSMKQMGPCGLLQVQNMATANTWITGSVDQARLLEGLKNI